jgi:hypothetical protein
VWWSVAVLILFANNVRLNNQLIETEGYRPDIGTADGFKIIMSRSKRAKELVSKGLLTTETMYESHLTQAGVVEQRLKRRLSGELLDLLRQGHIKAWGEPRDSKAEKEIDAFQRDMYECPGCGTKFKFGMRISVPPGRASYSNR